MARFDRKAGMLLASALFISSMALGGGPLAPTAAHGTARASGTTAGAPPPGGPAANVSWNSVSWNSVRGKP